MKQALGIRWKSIKKNDKGLHHRPQILFNLKKQHWGCCITKNIVKNNKVIKKKMSLKLTSVLISFQQPFYILEMIKILIKIIFSYCLRIFIILNSKKEEVILRQFSKYHSKSSVVVIYYSAGGLAG